VELPPGDLQWSSSVIIPPGGIGGNADRATAGRRGRRYTAAHVDPLDQHRAGLDGLTCAVCEGPVPGTSIHLLAQRDELVFAQMTCPACNSTTLAFVLEGMPGQTADRAVSGEPVTSDDVLDMHLLLRGWHGGLAELVAPESFGSGPAT
jgi:hypothetical protein